MLNVRERLRAARNRAFVAYEQRYGELHHADPRVHELVMFGNPEYEQWVAEVIRARNEGRPVPPLP
jgi:hypothetical protein